MCGCQVIECCLTGHAKMMIPGGRQIELTMGCSKKVEVYLPGMLAAENSVPDMEGRFTGIVKPRSGP